MTGKFKLNLTNIIFILGIGFLMFNLFFLSGNTNNSQSTNDCSKGGNIKCAEAKFAELKETELWQNIQKNQEKGIKPQEIEKIYGEAKTLRNIAVSKLEKEKSIYHEKILEILQSLPPQKQKIICEQNPTFIAKNQTEAIIQKICLQSTTKTEIVQGVNNTNDSTNIFIIKDLEELKK